MNKVKDQDVYFKSKKSRKKATQSQKNTSKSNGNKKKKSVEDENIQEGSNNFDITRSSVSSESNAIINDNTPIKKSKLNKPTEQDVFNETTIIGNLGNQKFSGTISKNKDPNVDYSQQIYDITMIIGGKTVRGKILSNDFDIILKHASTQQLEGETGENQNLSSEKRDQFERFQMNPSLNFQQVYGTNADEESVWINNQDTSNQQTYSWKYHDPSRSTKKQNQRWTNISFVGDMMMVNKDRYDEFSFLGSKYQTMVIQNQEEKSNESSNRKNEESVTKTS